MVGTLTDLQLAALLRANAVDADKELPLTECVRRFQIAPSLSQETWLRKAAAYLKDAAVPIEGETLGSYRQRAGKPGTDTMAAKTMVWHDGFWRRTRE